MGGIGRRNARGRAPQAQPPPRPPNFNSEATVVAAQRRGHAHAREGGRRDRGAEAGDNLVSGLAWLPGPETACVPTPSPRPPRPSAMSTLERVRHCATQNNNTPRLNRGYARTHERTRHPIGDYRGANRRGARGPSDPRGSDSSNRDIGLARLSAMPHHSRDKPLDPYRRRTRMSTRELGVM